MGIIQQSCASWSLAEAAWLSGVCVFWLAPCEGLMWISRLIEVHPKRRFVVTLEQIFHLAKYTHSKETSTVKNINQVFMLSLVLPILGLQE